VFGMGTGVALSR